MTPKKYNCFPLHSSLLSHFLLHLTCRWRICELNVYLENTNYTVLYCVRFTLCYVSLDYNFKTTVSMNFRQYWRSQLLFFLSKTFALWPRRNYEERVLTLAWKRQWMLLYENKWRQWKSLTYGELWSLVQCALKVRIRLTHHFSCLVSRRILLKFSWIPQTCESIFLFMLFCICGDVFKVNQSLPGCLLRSYWSEK